VINFSKSVVNGFYHNTFTAINDEYSQSKKARSCDIFQHLVSLHTYIIRKFSLNKRDKINLDINSNPVNIPHMTFIIAKKNHLKLILSFEK